MTSAVAVGIWEPFLPGEGVCEQQRAAGCLRSALWLQTPGCRLTLVSPVCPSLLAHGTDTWPRGGIWHPCPALPIRNATVTCVHQLAAARQGLGRESPVSGSLQRLSNLMMLQ